MHKRENWATKLSKQQGQHFFSCINDKVLAQENTKVEADPQMLTEAVQMENYLLSLDVIPGK